MTIQNYIDNEHEKINGWFSNKAMELIKAISDSQDKGNILEIGVYQGKSAIFLAMLLKDENLFCVDTFENDDLYYGLNSVDIFNENLDTFIPELKHKIQICQYKSSEFLGNSPCKFRLIHIDGSHIKDDVLIDLIGSYNNLENNGVIILDDVFNPNHPGVIEALIKYNETYHNLLCFAIGYNKVFLCKKEYYNRYFKLLDAFEPSIYRTFLDSLVIVFQG